MVHREHGTQLLISALPCRSPFRWLAKLPVNSTWPHEGGCLRAGPEGYFEHGGQKGRRNDTVFQWITLDHVR